MRHFLSVIGPFLFIALGYIGQLALAFGALPILGFIVALNKCSTIKSFVLGSIASWSILIFIGIMAEQKSGSPFLTVLLAVALTIIGTLGYGLGIIVKNMDNTVGWGEERTPTTMKRAHDEEQQRKSG